MSYMSAPPLKAGDITNDHLAGSITQDKITSLPTTKLTGTVTNAQLAGGIGGDKLSTTVQSSGIQSIGAGAAWTPAAGRYNIDYMDIIAGGFLEILVSAAWRRSLDTVAGQVVFDGGNMRVFNSTGAARNVAWQKF